MTDKERIWSIATETMQAFGPFYREATTGAIERSGIRNSWFALNLARGADPEPFSAQRYHEMNPYGALQRQAETLEELAKKDLLEAVGADAYRITDLGREIVEDIFHSVHESLGDCEFLPADEIEQLNHLLFRIVESTLNAPEPETKWAIAHSRSTDPGEDGAPAAKTDQYLTDLTFFRDDAHIGAWKPLGVSGHTWEALTLIWREQASTAEELHENLSGRAHTLEEYSAAIQDMLSRGWLVKSNGTYQITGEGKSIREQAEAATDRSFFVGWSALNEEALSQLEDLLTRANHNLKAMALERLWDLTVEVSRSISSVSRGVVDPLIQEHLENRPFFGFLDTANSIAPEPLSESYFRKRGTYTAPVVFTKILDEATEVGFFNTNEEGEFTITKKGLKVLTELEKAFYTRLDELDCLPEEDMGTIESLLKRTVDASLNSEEPANKLQITTSHNGHPAGYGPLAKIDQHIDDLRGFRDDAHIATWKPLGISGRDWETLTYIWRGEVTTAEELAERLENRGYSVDDYAQSLEELANRNWIKPGAAGYEITERGRALRQEAEDTTNRYFYEPWTSLDRTEQEQLRSLLTRLKIKLQELAEANQESTE